jgi:hypothetical protein
MAIEITTFLFLELKEDSFLGTRSVSHIIRLDEGHSRPVWEWVQNDNVSNRSSKSSWVPAMPETILEDGLLMLIADGLGEPSLAATADGLRARDGSVVDLNVNPVDPTIRQNIGEALNGYVVTILNLPGSHIPKLLKDFGPLGVEMRVATTH